ncbi:hypothetical protein ACIQVK_19450 [Streptomyces sp. NPDC090493]|uniref:hypothetical protein n=1 Tax=Streptomyces sp. NPDC090493 TaxID=3365964 RepID=UPI0037F58B85
MLRQHAGKILLIGTRALLALSVVPLGAGLPNDSPAASGTQADAVVQKLEDRASSRTHDALGAASEEQPSLNPTG